MRKQFTKTIEEIVATDEKSVLLLGDIGVFGFRNSLEKYPARAYNIGILEQATISMAAGLAKTGLIPIVHTIAPFIVERAFEQLKDDFVKDFSPALEKTEKSIKTTTDNLVKKIKKK
jgi:transketolase